jgi:hypothetical protein
VVDDPALDGELLTAFPEEMRGTFEQDILAHRLRREILATRLANRLVNRLGFVHPFELAEEEGVGLADIAAAFLAAEQLFGMQAIWQAIEDAPMAEKARILLMSRSADAMRSHMADLLRAGATTTAPSVLAGALAEGWARCPVRWETSCWRKPATTRCACPPTCWPRAPIRPSPPPSSTSSTWTAPWALRASPIPAAPIPSC